jgi:hypothetical protein
MTSNRGDIELAVSTVFRSGGANGGLSAAGLSIGSLAIAKAGAAMARASAVAHGHDGALLGGN